MKLKSNDIQRTTTILLADLLQRRQSASILSLVSGFLYAVIAATRLVLEDCVHMQQFYFYYFSLRILSAIIAFDEGERKLILPLCADSTELDG